MKLLEILRQIITEGNGPHEFGCVMLYFNFPEIKNIQKRINPEDVDGIEGLEQEPHTTLLYGLHDEVTVDQIKDILSDFKFGKCYVHNASVFEPEKYDVLKFDVKGKGLFKANKALSNLPHTDKFPDYIPHLTIGYLNKGTGEEYAEQLEGLEFELIPKYAVYSLPSGEKHKIIIKVDSQ